MTEKQKMILEGTEGMYNETGEMIPTKLFSPTDLKALVKLNKIKIVDNPYGIGDDFFGLIDKEYPKDFWSLLDHRKSRK